MDESIAGRARSVKRPAALQLAMAEHDGLMRRSGELAAEIRAEIAARTSGSAESTSGKRISELTALRDSLAPQLASARIAVLNARPPFHDAVRAVLEPARVRATAQVRDALAALEASLGVLLEVDQEMTRIGAERRVELRATLLSDLAAAIQSLPR